MGGWIGQAPRKRRELDWRIGAVVYQIYVDRFAASSDLEKKKSLYPEARHGLARGAMAVLSLPATWLWLHLYDVYICCVEVMRWELHLWLHTWVHNGLLPYIYIIYLYMCIYDYIIYIIICTYTASPIAHFIALGILVPRRSPLLQRGGWPWGCQLSSPVEGGHVPHLGGATKGAVHCRSWVAQDSALGRWRGWCVYTYIIIIVVVIIIYIYICVCVCACMYMYMHRQLFVGVYLYAFMRHEEPWAASKSCLI